MVDPAEPHPLQPGLGTGLAATGKAITETRPEPAGRQRSAGHPGARLEKKARQDEQAEDAENATQKDELLSALAAETEDDPEPQA
ncbi:MAG: hypothetical protein GY703_14485 [Gammaproteobacteria bacterium]|nr:hypothetical protein [Gammaproteobacteria bacterium]